MNSKNRIKSLLLVSSLALASMFCNAIGSDEEPESTKTAFYGTIKEVFGTVLIQRNGVSDPENAEVDQKILIGDQVFTLSGSRARMDLTNDTIIRINSNSNFTLTSIEDTSSGLFAELNLKIGEIWVILNGGSLNVDTPSGVASVRGSFLQVSVKPNGGIVEITCLEGECSVGNGAGTLNLIAGQTAKVTNFNSPPKPGKMSDDDVNDWLAANPEATNVIIPLTKTVAASKDDDLPQLETATQTPTATESFIEPTTVSANTATSTPSPTNINCGPYVAYDLWIGYIVQDGDTLEMLADNYQVPLAAFQEANCMGDTTFIKEGYHIYVPDKITVTPTITPSNTPTNTPAATAVPAATSTFTPTVTPTNSPAEFQNVSSPTGTLADCNNDYSIDVSEPDGVASVKLMYAWNDDTIASPSYKGLTQNSSFPNTYEGTINIDTYNSPAFSPTPADDIYYRFKVTDSQGSFSYYPDLGSSALTYSDALECGSPTTVNSLTAPADTSTIAACDQNYSVTVTDPDIVVKVKLVYSIDDDTFASPTYEIFTETIAGVQYDLASYTIEPTSGEVVYWRLNIYDTTGDLINEPNTGSYSFTSITCP